MSHPFKVGDRVVFRRQAYLEFFATLRQSHLERGLGDDGIPQFSELADGPYLILGVSGNPEDGWWYTLDPEIPGEWMPSTWAELC